MIESIQGLINNHSYPKVLLLFGEEEFLLEEAFLKLTKSVKKDINEYDFDFFDAEDKGADEQIRKILTSCTSYPFVSDKRVVIVKHFNRLFSERAKKSDEKSIFAKYLENPQSTTFLILLAEIDSLNGLSAAMKDSKNSSKAQKMISSVKFPYKQIIDRFSWIEFPKIYENKYSAWVKSRFSESGKKINDDACEFLIANSVPSLRELNNQIEKILIFMNNEINVTPEIVSKVSGFSRVYNVFELQKMIGRRRLSDSLFILEKMLSTEAQEMLIMTIISKYFVSLWKLFDASQIENDQYKLASLAGINRFFLQEYLEALRNYSINEIESAFIYLAETDEKLKSTSIPASVLLQQLFIKIMKK